MAGRERLITTSEKGRRVMAALEPLEPDDATLSRFAMNPSTTKTAPTWSVRRLYIAFLVASSTPGTRTRRAISRRNMRDS